MKINRTLFPLTASQVLQYRADVACKLRRGGFSFREIRQILKCSGPEEARRLVAKGWCR